MFRSSDSGQSLHDSRAVACPVSHCPLLSCANSRIRSVRCFRSVPFRTLARVACSRIRHSATICVNLFRSGRRGCSCSRATAVHRPTSAAGVSPRYWPTRRVPVRAPSPPWVVGPSASGTGRYRSAGETASGQQSARVKSSPAGSTPRPARPADTGRVRHRRRHFGVSNAPVPHSYPGSISRPCCPADKPNGYYPCWRTSETPR